MEKTNLFYKALISKYDAEINEAIASMNLYFNNSVGIGEHPQHLEEVDKMVEKLANASDKKEMLMITFSRSGKYIE